MISSSRRCAGTWQAHFRDPNPLPTIRLCDSRRKVALLRGWNPCRSVQSCVTAQEGLRNDGFLSRVVCDLSGRAFLFCHRINRCRRGVDQRTFPQFCEHPRSKSVPGADHAAANHEHLKIKNVDQIRKKNSQYLTEALKDTLSSGVSLDREVVDRLRAKLGVGIGHFREFWSLTGFDRLSRHANNGRGGGITLGASSISASAGNAVRLDRNVSEFSRHAAHAVEKFAIEDDGPSNAGTEREHRHIVDRAART